MRKSNNPALSKISTSLALAGLIGVASLGMVACQSKIPHIVACQGVPTKNNSTLYIDKGICKKLGGGKPVPTDCKQWNMAKNGYYTCADAGSHLKAPQYLAKDYIKCYGVAAAGMNDCGTKNTACSGSVHVARQKDAWIALPAGLCKQIKGSIPMEHPPKK